MAGKHTPGPWVWITPLKELNSAHGKIFDYAAYEGMWFAQYDASVDEANARLIAAAPDLLEACQRALEQTDPVARSGDYAMLNAAIQRATQPLPPPNEES